jgi:hypothetical protein
MKDISFYYVPDISKDNVTGELKEVLRPKIPIRLSMNHKMFPQVMECLFDTGSDRNLFPAEVAKYLGIKVEKGKLQKIGGIGNNDPIEAYTHNVKIFVGKYSFDTEIDFSFMHKLPILGRKGFMDKYESIEVNEKKKYIKLISI